MENFYYSIPTKVYFGKGQIESLGNAIKKYGERVLIVYGGGSIKKIGLYDKMIEILDENKLFYTELSGVDPNPRIESVREGIKRCIENSIEVVLAVGGGSTIDCAKVIAAAIEYENDPWDIVKNPGKITKALPIVTILTLAATGSEMNRNAVISNMSINEKVGTASELMKPKVSIMDPEYTYSVSKYQTAAGTADIMSHIFENYFTHTNAVDIQDSTAEGLLRACIKYGKIAVEDPTNYDARANLMWASSWAINGLISYGTKNIGWTVHPMEHELSAFYDITHGVGLAILTPHWMKYSLNDNTVDKIAQYGINVWGIDKELDKYEIANKSIEKTSEFFKELGIPSTLREVGINEEKFEVMARKVTNKEKLGTFYPLTTEDIINIYKLSL